MQLTLTIDLSHTRATLVEKHSLVAGDVYNPLYVDFSQLTPAQIAAIDTGSLALTLRKVNAAGDIIASTRMFSDASITASDGTSTPCPKMRQATLLLNTQSVANWFKSVSKETAPNMSVTAYLELSDANVTYAACEIPLVLRSFTVGGTNPGYYTKEEVDALVGKKQGSLTAVAPVVISDGTITAQTATASRLGVVKVGKRLSIDSSGVLSAEDQSISSSIDDTLDDSSTNPIQNKPVAEAIDGLATRISSLDNAATGRVKALEDSVAKKVDASTLAKVATSGSYADLSDKPVIPTTDAIGNKWYTGNKITGTSTSPTIFNNSGISDANVGDMYLNTDTATVYRCTAAGASAAALWAYACTIKGATGSAGLSGQVKATYTSIQEMQNAFSTDGLQTGELALVNTGDVTDEDNGKLYKKGANAYEFLCDLSGTPGNKWYFGTAVTGESTTGEAFPATGVVANTGDFYLNSSTSAVYSCISGGSPDSALWEFYGVIKGAQGERGESGVDGSIWYSGTAITGVSTNETKFPSSGVELAKANDKYFNTETGDVYSCVTPGFPSEATWVYLINLKGIKGDAGESGNVWKFGTAVSGSTPGAVDVSGGANIGDCYLNTSTCNYYQCTTHVNGVPVWTLLGVLKGADGANGSDGSSWHYGTSITGEVPVSGTVKDDLPLHVGDMYFNTNTNSIYRCIAVTSTTVGTWEYLCTVTAGGVTATSQGVSGSIPKWGSKSGVLDGSYLVNTSTAINDKSSASGSTIPTEYSVALSLSEYVKAPTSHKGETLMAWGDSSADVAANEYAVQTTVRKDQYASDTAIPTEKAVRTAINTVQSNLDGKKIDELNSGTMGSKKLDATNAVHGLMSSADKAKLDSLIDPKNGGNLSEPIADDDTVSVFNASESSIPRLATATVVWDYIKGKLPTFALDDMGLPDDTTDLDVNTARHGLVPKLPFENGDRKVFCGNGTWVLNEAANTFEGDTGSGGTRGQVPAPAAGDGLASKFLCADGHWAVVPGAWQFSPWTFSDSGAWVLSWDYEASNWTVSDGTHTGVLAAQYDRTAEEIVFTWDEVTTSEEGEESVVTHTVTATRTALSNVDVHSLSNVTALAADDEFLVHDTSAGSQCKVALGEFASFAQAFNKYETLFVPAGAMTPAIENGATATEVITNGILATNDAMKFLHGAQADSFVDFNVMLPDNWDAGDIKMKLVWHLPNVNSASVGDNIKFSIACVAYGDMDERATKFGDIVYVEDSVHSGSEVHLTNASAVIPIGGTALAGKMLHFKVGRSLSAVTDSCPEDVLLLGVNIQYRCYGATVAW